MGSEVRNFVVSTPAGTAIATPLTTSLAMPAREVEHIRVRIPPGPNGQLGWMLSMAGTPVIPTNAGGWIVGNDEIIDWDLTGQPNSGAWQLQSYNIGGNPHSVYITFTLNPIGARSSLPTSPLAIEA